MLIDDILQLKSGHISVISMLFIDIVMRIHKYVILDSEQIESLVVILIHCDSCNKINLGNILKILQKERSGQDRHILHLRILDSHLTEILQLIKIVELVINLNKGLANLEHLFCGIIINLVLRFIDFDMRVIDKDGQRNKILREILDCVLRELGDVLSLSYKELIRYIENTFVLLDILYGREHTFCMCVLCNQLVHIFSTERFRKSITDTIVRIIVHRKNHVHDIRTELIHSNMIQKNILCLQVRIFHVITDNTFDDRNKIRPLSVTHHLQHLDKVDTRFIFCDLRLNKTDRFLNRIEIIKPTLHSCTESLIQHFLSASCL